MDVAAQPVPIGLRLLPILGWLPYYRRDWLLPDVLAGLAVWAVMVPEGIAYASIVGIVVDEPRGLQSSQLKPECGRRLFPRPVHARQVR